jgi:PII-like signaling protein
MKGTHLRFYTYENRRHGSALLYEWLLERAKALGVHGGSAFRAIAGFGRHGKFHEQHFFELAGDVPVLVEFILDDAHADALLDDLRREKVTVFYARVAAEFDVIDSDRTT